MFSPHGRSKHLNYHFSERVVLRTTDLVQQCSHAETTRMRAHRWNARFSPSVGIVQFENEFARSWHVRREESIATFDACKMDIRHHAPSQRRWCARIL